MPTPTIVSREEWRAARQELLAEENELARARDAVSAARRRLPMVEVDKAYVFAGLDGSATLPDLFAGRRQLIVYHAMFEPQWDAACPDCSFLIDNIGHLSHLHAADTTLVLVSRAPSDRVQAYRQRMGWTVPWYSSHDSDFNDDFGVTVDPARGLTEYNYRRMGGDWAGELPGTSVFLREGDRVFHTYSCYARGGDILLGTVNYLDLTPLGRQEDEGVMHWLRRHDEYPDEQTADGAHVCGCGRGEAGA